MCLIPVIANVASCNVSVRWSLGIRIAGRCMYVLVKRGSILLIIKLRSHTPQLVLTILLGLLQNVIPSKLPTNMRPDVVETIRKQSRIR
jgi:hypothetical protein